MEHSGPHHEGDEQPGAGEPSPDLQGSRSMDSASGADHPDFGVRAPDGSRGADAIGLEIEFGADVFEGGYAGVAQDWVALRDYRRETGDATDDDVFLFAEAAGLDSVRGLMGDAKARGDDVAAADYLSAVIGLDAMFFDRGLELLGRNPLADPDQTDDSRDAAPGDDPPVIMPRRTRQSPTGRSR